MNTNQQKKKFIGMDNSRFKYEPYGVPPGLVVATSTLIIRSICSVALLVLAVAGKLTLSLQQIIQCFMQCKK